MTPPVPSNGLVESRTIYIYIYNIYVYLLYSSMYLIVLGTFEYVLLRTTEYFPLDLFVCLVPRTWLDLLVPTTNKGVREGGLLKNKQTISRWFDVL